MLRRRFSTIATWRIDIDTDNEIIREIREIRHQIAQDCGNDIRKIGEHANKAYEAFLARTHAA